MTFTLDDAAIDAALAEMEAAPPASVFRHYKPLSEAADEYEQWARHPERRLYTGIEELDLAMRGTAPGELTEILGFSHSGKTLVATKILMNNPDKRIALFTADETRTLVLVKLACATFSTSARQLEAGLQADDPDAKRLLRDTCRMYPNLAVFDQITTTLHMTEAMKEIQDAWGAGVDAVMFDYLDLLDDAETVPLKASSIKTWGKRHDVPVFLLHQSSRTAGKDGQKVTMTSGGYGGEQQATHIIGVRRRKYDILAKLDDLRVKLENPNTGDDKRWAIEQQITDLEQQLQEHEFTLTVNLVKNKRPPCDLVDDIDYEVDARTGELHQLAVGEKPRQYLAQRGGYRRPQPEQMEAF